MNKETNKLLKAFLETIKTQAETGETVLDIREIMNTRQFNKFKQLEKVINTLFKSDKLFDGLEKTVNGKSLTEAQQVSVLAIMKIFEAFVTGVSKAQDKVSSDTMSEVIKSGGADRMYN